MSETDNNLLPIDRFDYHLPDELIAQRPIEPRDSSRLLVIDRASGQLEDRVFRDLPDILQPDDVLVMNDTRVIPARLFARRQTGGKVEFLFLDETEPDVWRALARPARRLRDSDVLDVLTLTGEDSGAALRIIGREQGGAIIVHLERARSVLDAHGKMPLPPYIGETLSDAERYQTVIARSPGSAAAPTAGLHFTDDVLDRCRGRGIETLSLTLHVGLDTFQPVKVENALEHQIHSEWYGVSPQTITTLRAARQAGRRIVAVGTTVARTLETIAETLDSEGGRQGSTRIYITPPYEFKLVDAMLTNFHLPRTTLLLMVSALAGEDLIRRAYAHAIEQHDRFYSFGDATLIV